jgi:hypothetical protein
VKVKGVAERGLGQDKRGRGGGEREEGKVRVRDTTTTKFRTTTTPNYLPMESTTHTPKKYFSFNTMDNGQFLSSPYKN